MTNSNGLFEWCTKYCLVWAKTKEFRCVILRNPESENDVLKHGFSVNSIFSDEFTDFPSFGFSPIAFLLLCLPNLDHFSMIRETGIVIIEFWYVIKIGMYFSRSNVKFYSSLETQLFYWVSNVRASLKIVLKYYTKKFWFLLGQ